MGKVKRSEVLGFAIGEEIVCGGCLTNGDDATEDEIIKEDVDDDYVYFCDRCKGML